MRTISGHPAVTGGGESSGALSELDAACAVNAAWNALTYVCHPELGLDVVSLGLIYDVRGDSGDSGVIIIEMTLPRPGSPAGEGLPDAAKGAVLDAVAGVAVDLRMVWNPPWSPAMIDPVAARAAGLRFG